MAYHERPGRAGSSPSAPVGGRRTGSPSFGVSGASGPSPEEQGASPHHQLGRREAWTHPLDPLDLVELAVDGGTLEPGFSPATTRYRIVVRARDGAGWGADATGVRLRIRARPAREHTPVLFASSTGEVIAHAPDVGWFTGAPGAAHHLTIALGAPGGPVRTVSLAVDPPPAP